MQMMNLVAAQFGVIQFGAVPRRKWGAVKRVLCVVFLVSCVSSYAQGGVNRRPVSDKEFQYIAEHYKYDVDAPLDETIIDSWTFNIPYTVEKVVFSSIQDERVPAYFVLPQDSTLTKRPGILLLHGNNTFWGKNGEWSLGWMDILVREGWCVLVPDLKRLGERQRPGDVHPENQLPYELRDSFIQWVTDQRRGIDYLSSRVEVDPDRIILMGGSMGGLMATLTAGLEDRLAGVVLTVSDSWPVDRATDDPLYKFIHTLNFAPRIQAPTLVVGATGDGIEPGQELYDALNCPKQIVWYETEHYQPPHKYSADIVKWLHGRLDASN